METLTERIKTGISELDSILGGFPAGKTILVTGDPGTGKTIFGLQLAMTSCAQGLKTVYISTEESAGDLRLQGKAFGWNLRDFETNGLLRFIELAGNRATEIETALSISLDTVKGNFAQLLEQLPDDTRVLIVDSIGSHASNLTSYEFRDRFDLFVYNLKIRRISSMVILDSATSGEFNDIALFSAHGAIQLLKRDNPYTGRRERVMDIIKMRNTRTPIQFIIYEITTGGIKLISPIDFSESHTGASID